MDLNDIDNQLKEMKQQILEMTQSLVEKSQNSELSKNDDMKRS